jgi:hypothetical protein
MSWIKFKDKRPDPRKKVLISDGYEIGVSKVKFYTEGKMFIQFGNSHLTREIEWWHPLPELPKKEIV